MLFIMGPTCSSSALCSYMLLFILSGAYPGEWCDAVKEHPHCGRDDQCFSLHLTAVFINVTLSYVYGSFVQCKLNMDKFSVP